MLANNNLYRLEKLRAGEGGEIRPRLWLRSALGTARHAGNGCRSGEAKIINICKEAVESCDSGGNRVTWVSSES